MSTKSRKFKAKQRLLKRINRMFIKHYKENKKVILDYLLPLK